LSNEREYRVRVPSSIEVEYDRQNDILYLYLEPGETPEEELLSEEGDIVLGFKEGRLVVIEVHKFSEKIGGYII
jgi:uncharacterized protein YuzE